MKKFIASLIAVGFAAICLLVGYLVTHETIPAGYVGYVYDRNVKGGDNVIEGTSVINVARTGRIRINPITQEVLRYPTTIVAKNWTSADEGDNKGEDWSMQIGAKEGKNIDADIYISVRPTDIAKIIKSFGTKPFDSIVNDDIYGLTKGKLSIVSQKYSVYDVQASRSQIQKEAFDILSEELEETYGVTLVRLEIGTLRLPSDIQDKIDQKTNAQNQVELAKLERQKQDEINQQVVDQQKAQSEKEKLERQAKADASAYEKEAAAKAELAAQEAKLKTAELKVQQAKLEKEAELEKQKSYTEQYFRDKELDNERAAVDAINSNVEIIVTDGKDGGLGSLVGLGRVLESLK